MIENLRGMLFATHIGYRAASESYIKRRWANDKAAA